MYTLNGKWFDGKTSQQVEASCYIDGSGMTKLYLQPDRRCVFSGDFSALKVSPRLGNTPRYVYFPNGGKFECADNDTLDQCCQQINPSPVQQWIHKLETHWHYVLLTLGVVVLFSWAVVVYGVPATAKHVAKMLPHQVSEFASEQTLDMLDKTFMKPSTLDEDVKQRLAESFAPVLAAHPGEPLRVLFRDGGRVGANAFALPDGTMIFTDQMVQLAKNDDELIAVLAHEIGHVVHHHGMRLAIQDSILAFLLVAITGDISTTSELLVALPLILTQMSYSRDFERESDDYALAYMKANNIEPIHFVNLMTRLEASIACQVKFDKADEEEAAEEVIEESAEATEQKSTLEHCEENNGSDESSDSSMDSVLDYFSSHPTTAERLQQFR
ncbi:M48 family metallopeptidase [Maricurvus nonylphenolicus]|uniref:M48 family metallopeptidase n=1 Tax=Maricurvus nonylphenolicus TaxID=1008307 RepID=UPI0036F32D73